MQQKHLSPPQIKGMQLQHNHYLATWELWALVWPYAATLRRLHRWDHLSWQIRSLITRLRFVSVGGGLTGEITRSHRSQGLEMFLDGPEKKNCCVEIFFIQWTVAKIVDIFLKIFFAKFWTERLLLGKTTSLGRFTNSTFYNFSTILKGAWTTWKKKNTTIE